MEEHDAAHRKCVSARRDGLYSGDVDLSTAKEGNANSITLFPTSIFVQLSVSLSLYAPPDSSALNGIRRSYCGECRNGIGCQLRPVARTELRA